MTWFGAMALTCFSLVMASGDAPPQTASDAPAQVQATAAKAEPAAPLTPAPATPSADKPVSNPKEAGIREQLQGFAKAFNAPDVDALMELFTPDAVVVDPSGSETRGIPAIGDMYAEGFGDGSRAQDRVQRRGDPIPHRRRGAGRGSIAPLVGHRRRPRIHPLQC